MPSVEELPAELERDKEARITAEAESRNWQERARIAEDKLVTVCEGLRPVLESLE